MSIETNKLMNLGDGKVLYDDLRVRKADTIIASSSGSIASFSDGADNLPMKSVVASIVPVQDLHGQKSPYPAGGGKNLLQITATTDTRNGVTFTVNNDGSVTITGATTSNNADFVLNSAFSSSASTILNGCPSGGSSSKYMINATGGYSDIGSGVNLPANYNNAIYIRVAANYTIPTGGVTFYPMIRRAISSNLFDKTKASDGVRVSNTGADYSQEGYFSSEYIPVTVGKTYMKNSPTADAYHRYATYDSSKAWVRKIDDNNTITIASGESYIRFCGETSEEDTAEFGLVSDATFEPYSNICPITGWTGVNVTRTGKNLLTLEGYKWANSTGVKEVDRNVISTPDLIPTAPGEKFTYYRNQQTSENSSLVARLYNASKGYIGNGTSMINTETGSKTITIPANAYYVAFTQFGAVGVTGLQVQVERGDTYTGYEEPTYTVYSITWTSAGTVYGGYLNVTTGVLTVEYGIADLGDLAWSVSSDNVSFISGTAIIGIKIPASQTAGADAICSNYKAYKSTDLLNGTFGVAPSGKVKVRDDAFNLNTTNFTTAMDGVQLVYRLATPITYTLTPTEIRTLVGGFNNLFADTGDVSVEYPADTKRYVDQNERITDVQINGTSITNNGVANVPYMGNGTFGVAKLGNTSNGLFINSGMLYVSPVTDEEAKAGTAQYRPIVPNQQHKSVFYGLAKASGDTTQASSSNAVGTYTADALVKIQKMLGIYQSPWELIREDTVTNATEADIEITVDGNGSAFELTDIRIVFDSPVQDSQFSIASYGTIKSYYDASQSIDTYIGAYTQAANASQRFSFAEILQQDGMCKMSYVKNGNRGDDLPWRSVGTDNSFILSSVQKAFSKVVIKKVTGKAHYKLYGKRKWT